MSTGHIERSEDVQPSADDRPDGPPLPTLASLASDPVLVAGIYETCDQWCMYCQATNRCLAFRASNAAERGSVWDACETEGERVYEGMSFIKELADAEGRAAPPEIEAMLSSDRERLRAVLSLDDPLERLGRSYMNLAEAYLRSRADFPAAIRWRQSGAAPLELLTWFHVLAPARVFRAVLCAEEAREGVAGRHVDALGSAKIALVGCDRSLAALEAIAVDDEDPRLELLTERLHDLREAIEARFPAARSFVRTGLDHDAPRLGLAARGIARLQRLLHWRGDRPGVEATGNLRGSARGTGAPRG